MKNESRQAPASVVDLFCGVGGLAYGFAKAGLRVTAGVDVDESCRYAFEANTGAKFICKSVNDVTPRELSELYSGSGRRIMIGCAPCQPFSSYNRNRTSDPKWFLLNAFMRLVQGTAPHIVSMENVPRLRSHKVFRKFVRRLKDEGYHVWHDSVICSNYGVPQTRRRLVLLASRLGGIDMIGKTHNEPPTVRDAIGDLEHIQAGCSFYKRSRTQIAWAFHCQSRTHCADSAGGRVEGLGSAARFAMPQEKVRTIIPKRVRPDVVGSSVPYDNHSSHSAR